MLEDIQKAVDKWIHEVGKGYFSELTNMAEIGRASCRERVFEGV